GEGTVVDPEGNVMRFYPGRTILMPAALQEVTFRMRVLDNARWSILHAMPPDPLSTVRAG
ncbi:MAG: hypothetical protein VXX30_06920, partial [Planctomycetota bacterium]|nr:hypothetical protein [Planctomycetota bacterium]